MAYSLQVKHKAVTVAVLLVGVASPALAQEDIQAEQLLNLSLEQLSNIEVTSVSKKPEKVSEAAAAIFVIGQDDIARSGMTSIPELLRMVPGLSVAQSGAHTWAISARGFTGQFSNKLLVLIDGRTVYSPLYSGVYWDVQDTPLQDIERIEVIRGPGASLWGANAVNGVINIITKKAQDTQGGMLSQTVGNVDRSLTTVRYGGKIGEHAHARVYAKYDERDEFRTTSDTGAQDMWNKAQGGFRIDHDEVEGVSWTLQGDVYRSGQDYPLNIPSLTSPFSRPAFESEVAQGGNVLARINQKISDESIWTLQMYFDNQQRQNQFFDDHRSTIDLELQHNWQPHEDHSLVWGMGYRLIFDHIEGTQFVNFSPEDRSYGLFNAFLQDEIQLIDDTLKLTLGSKFEHNDFTGIEIQPSARLTWLVDDRQTLWASASRAVRTPNRFSDDGAYVVQTTSLGGGNFGFLQQEGNRRFESEELHAFELGYRVQAKKNLSFDIATFYNHYLEVVANSVGTATQTSFEGGTPYFVVPITPTNANRAKSHGVELAAQWEPFSNWRLNGTYTYLSFKRKTPEPAGFALVNNAPTHQASLRSTVLLDHGVSMSNSVYYVDQIASRNIDSNIRFDTRLAWQVLPSVELSIVGQNLLDESHPEFGAFLPRNPSEVPRSFYGNVTWTF